MFYFKGLLVAIIILYNLSVYGQTIQFDTIAPFVINKKTGFISNKGKIIIKPKFQSSFGFECDSICWVEIKNKKGYINKQGRIIIPIIYSYLSTFNNGVASAEINNKVGFINRKGETVIPFEIDNSDIYYLKLIEGLILLKNSDFKYGFIDTLNKLVIPYQYDYAQVFQDGHAIVGNKNFYEKILHGTIDKKNKIHIPLIYDELIYQYNNLYIARQWFEIPVDSNHHDFFSKFGCVDSNNHVVIPFQYDSIKPRYDFIYLKESSCHKLELEDHLACFKFESGWRIMNLKGEETTCCYDTIKTIIKGHLPVKKGKWGLIDTIGKVKIPFEYDDITVYTDKIVVLKKGNKFAYYNTEGTKLSDFIYDYASEFRFGYALVRQNGIYNLVDINGNIKMSNLMVEETYKVWLGDDNFETRVFIHEPVQGPNTILFCKNHKFGLMDMNGKVLFPAKADEPIHFVY